jgi:hypothetical protein
LGTIYRGGFRLSRPLKKEVPLQILFVVVNCSKIVPPKPIGKPFGDKLAPGRE